MFDNKRPKWFYGLAVGIITEVIHMLMIFLTNMSDVHTAFSFVRTCSLPMIAINALAVMAAVALVSFLGRRGTKREHHSVKKISQTFQRWLLLCVVAGFLLTTLFTWALQTELSANDAYPAGAPNKSPAHMGAASRAFITAPPISTPNSVPRTANPPKRIPTMI